MSLLDALRFVGHRLPRWPKTHAITNRVLKPLYARFDQRAVTSNVLGFRMELDPTECVDAMLLFSPQLYDPNEVALIRERVREGDVFVDVGANIGFYTLLAAGLVGKSGRVLAVEADPANYRCLVDNLDRNGVESATAVQVGVSDRQEVLRLSLHQKGNKGGHSFAGAGGGGVEVRCDTLCRVLSQAGVERVDFMKMDIEGFEYRVLSEFFATCDGGLFPTYLQYEHTHLSSDELTDLIDAHGYEEVLRTPYNRVVCRGR